MMFRTNGRFRRKRRCAKLKASAMVYALVFMLLVTLISSAVMYIGYANELVFDINENRRKLIRNCQSGLNLAIYGEEIGRDSREKIDLFGLGKDSVEVIKRSWGAYEAITCVARGGKETIARSRLIAPLMDDQNSWAIRTPENHKALVLCGNTVVRGDCYLSEAGVKRGSIAGQQFVGKYLVEGKISVSNSDLPQPDQGLFNVDDPGTISLALKDSIVLWEDWNWDVVTRSFAKSTIHLLADYPVVLDEKTARGNFKISSSHSITIDASCNLDQVLFFAPEVTVGKGFRGCIHAAATDKISVEEDADLVFPSSLMLVTSADSDSPSVSLASESDVSGILIALSGNGDAGVVCSIGKNSKFTGEIFVDGMVEHYGLIVGQITTNGFRCYSQGSLYQNHLLNASVDRNALPAGVPGLLWGEGRKGEIANLP